jgi:hypothetical protein
VHCPSNAISCKQPLTKLGDTEFRCVAVQMRVPFGISASTVSRARQISESSARDASDQTLKYVAAFRAYAWDDDIHELACRFFASCPGARHVVLLDESRGSIDIGGFEKVSHTEDSACLQLPIIPVGSSLWYNVDYGIYFLAKALPDYDYYLLSESDLAVNLSLAPMMAAVSANAIDLVTHDVRPADSGWFWYPNSIEVYDSPWRSLLYFMVVSRRAATALLAARQELARRLTAGTVALWPFCEIFVPSALMQIGGFKVADIGEFAGVKNLNFRPRIVKHDPVASQPGTLVHSVLGRQRFIATLLAESRPSNFFRPGSELYIGLRRESFDDVAPKLRQALLRGREHAGLVRLQQEMVIAGMADGVIDDLALNKPALTSSVSVFSAFPDPARDACGANSEIIADDFGFHTASDVDPWWMVDLLKEHVIDRVEIVNRVIAADRFRVFSIEGSRDGTAWTTRFTKITMDDISSDLENPWSLSLLDPFVARYVRIKLLGTEPFHLRKVRVFGRSISA